MSWQDIPGWFDFEPIYDRWAQDIPADGTFVEVGCFMGRSLGYWLDRLAKYGKLDSVKTYAVDPWDYDHEPAEGTNTYGDTWAGDLQQSVDPHGNLFSAFLYHTTTCLGAHANRIRVVRAPSVRGARLFEVGSIDRVWIDADHCYTAMMQDIAAWRPLIKRGGCFGGHDYSASFPGLIRAVDEVFGKGHRYADSNSWELTL